VSGQDQRTPSTVSRPQRVVETMTNKDRDQQFASQPVLVKWLHQLSP